MRLPLWRWRRDKALDEEIDAHFRMAIRDRVERGVSPEQAARDARREFGNVALVKEVTRGMWGWTWLEQLVQDVEYGWRMLSRAPGFAAVAVFTLALGVGANTAIFSVVDAVLLRPLPYSRPEQLVMVWEKVGLPAYHNDQNTPAPGNFGDWRRENTVFGDMAAIGYRSWSLTGIGEPVRVEGEAVSAGLFSILQADAALGRVFTPDDDRPGGPRVVLLGYGLWVGRFGGDRQIIGQTIHLNEEPYTVVGVMPTDFHFPDRDDQLWVPIALSSEQLANHGSHFLRVVARLKPQVTVQQAQAQMDAIAQRLTEQYPMSNTGVGVTVVSLREQIVRNVRPSLYLLVGVVSFLLLMVCANVGNLLLARGSARSREFGIRTALGASRGRLLRQLLAESATLGLLGGALGLVFAVGGMHALKRLAPPDLPRIDEIGLNGSVQAFNFGVSLLAAFIFGLVPALQTDRHGVQEVLREDARGSASGSRLRIRNLIVVAETALGVVVLVGAGLLLRSFLALERVPLGFRSENVLSLRVILPTSRYATLSERTGFYGAVLERIESLPGVQSAGAISFLPLTFSGRTSGIAIEGHPSLTPGELPFVDFRSVTPEYFHTMDISLVEGRDFSWADRPETLPVAIISQAMARTFWPGEDPLGKRVKMGRADDSRPWLTIVGVVGNVRQLDMISPSRPTIYFPVSQDQGTGETLRDWVVRASGDPASVASAVRAAVWAADPNLPISRVQTMSQVRSAYLGPRQFSVVLVGLFAISALVLAAIGVYGVTAYSVTQRTQELGIRIALGAQRDDVLRLVLWHGAKLTMMGLALGLVAALMVTRLMATLLYGVGARDPMTFGGVASLLLLVSLLAGYLPARRAVRIDPTIALRYE